MNNEETIKYIELLKKKLNDLMLLVQAKKGINYITIHHTAGNQYDGFRGVDEQGKLDGYPMSSLGHTMAYHYFIDVYGTVTQGREDTEYSQHARGVSRGNIGVCLGGNFEEYNPSEKQLSALFLLIEKLKYKYYICNKEIKGHKDWNNTLCCGKYLYKWVKETYS